MEQAVTDGYCLFKIVRTERRTDMTLQIIYPDHFVRSEISQIKDAVMLSNLKIVRILFIQVSAGQKTRPCDQVILFIHNFTGKGCKLFKTVALIYFKIDVFSGGSGKFSQIPVPAVPASGEQGEAGEPKEDAGGHVVCALF